MKLRENPAMKALAFVAAVAAFAATAIMGWYQLANYDALWSPEYDAGDGYSIYYLEQMDAVDIQWLVNYTQARQAGQELNVYEEQELARLESELSAENTNLRWQVLGEDKSVVQGNTQDRLPLRAVGLFWTDFEPWSTNYSVDLIQGVAWGRLAEGAANVTDVSNAVYTDDWQERLAYYWQLYQAYVAGAGTGDTAPSEQEWSQDEVNLDTVFLAADGTAPMLLVSSFSGNYLYAPCLRWLLEANEFGYQYQLDAGSWDQVEEGAETMQLSALAG